MCCNFHLKDYNWTSPNLSKLTPYQISSGLTHFGSEASNCSFSYLTFFIFINKDLFFEIEEKKFSYFFTTKEIYHLLKETIT